MRNKVFIILFIFFYLQGNTQSLDFVNLELISDKLVAPIGMACPNDGSGRMFVIEQRGMIYIIDKNKKLLPTPFLDISKKIIKQRRDYDERGLLGIAFHPNYKKNKRFFIYYSSNLNAGKADHIAVLAEYKGDPYRPEKALTKEKIILQIAQPESNHNGGHILFDKNGLLYLGLGDGGSGGDPHGEIGNGQNKNTLLGKILRINVDDKTPYAIPSDNPFVGKPNTKPEIFAYGLRNPWRFSLDNLSDRIFCGDVGQNKYEEVNIIEKGKNYGWRIMEGLHCYDPEENCNKKGLVMPISEYGRSDGTSVTGGYIYRGKKIPFLYGKYVFADWKGGFLLLTEHANKTWKREKLKVNLPNSIAVSVNSFGEDMNGELYILTQGDWAGPFAPTGKLYKIIK